MLLVIGGIKGGSGKTTLATNLAVCRARLGKTVLLVDADEQQSAMVWQTQRIPFLPITVGSHVGKDLYDAIDGYVDFYDEVIIDTGGRDTTSQRAALLKCDVFLAPFRPRSLDVWTIVMVRRLLAEIREVNTKFQAFAVLNQCDPRGDDSEQCKKILHDEGLNCLDVQIGSRKAFPNSSSAGIGVIEYQKSDVKSIHEILSLHDDIYRGNMLEIYKSNKEAICPSPATRLKKLLSEVDQ